MDLRDRSKASRRWVLRLAWVVLPALTPYPAFSAEEGGTPP
jgi:hypothetical protein